MEIRNVVVPDLYQQGLLNSHSVYTSPIFQPFQPGFQTYNLSIKGKTFFFPQSPHYKQTSLAINNRTQQGMVQCASESIAQCNNPRRLLVELVSCSKGTQLLQHVYNFFLSFF